MAYYVLTTAPQLEFRAQAAIERMGFETLVPDELHPKRARYSPVAGKMIEPSHRRVQIMRGYVIVNVDWSGLLYTIKHHVNASRRIIGNPLGIDFIPKAVPWQIIEHLKSISGKHKAVQPEVKRLTIGDRATIVSGPMAGQIVTVDSKSGATLWHEFLGSVREIKIPIAALEAAE